MDLLMLVVSAFIFGPPLLFLAMSIRHFIPLLRGTKYPWWASLLGPIVFLNRQYLSPDALSHRMPWACYTAAFIGWVLVLVFVFDTARNF
jgi:hypothetical protein